MCIKNETTSDANNTVQPDLTANSYCVKLSNAVYDFLWKSDGHPLELPMSNNNISRVSTVYTGND